MIGPSLLGSGSCGAQTQRCRWPGCVYVAFYELYDLGPLTSSFVSISLLLEREPVPPPQTVGVRL